MPDPTQTPHAGFQGSETSSAEVTVYTQAGDPVILTAASERDATIAFDGRRPSDNHPALTSVTTSKALGGGAGNWSVTAKPSPAANKMFNQIMDDDWVDIVFKRHNRQWHNMRGLVDNVQRERVVSGQGATVEQWVMTGRDFTKVWQITPIWFNPYTDQASIGGLAYRIAVDNAMSLSPDKTVDALLRGFLDALGEDGQAPWKLPDAMPNHNGDFASTFITDYDDFVSNVGETKRVAFGQSFSMIQGKLWDLAQEWGDLPFCELITDTLPFDLGLGHEPDREVPIKDSVMSVVFRDRPFPNLDEGSKSRYFSLPLHIIPRQQLMPHVVGRNGMERFNAFFASPVLAVEDKSEMDINQPLWDRQDIAKHGLRRFDVTSRYVAVPGASNLVGLGSKLRERARDWHCLNPYFLNGSVNLAVGRPEIHIGQRVRIPGNTPKEDETYYVEQVNHNWTFGPGTRTNLGLTRGWIGSDNSYLDALQKVAANYQLAPREAAIEV